MTFSLEILRPWLLPAAAFLFGFLLAALVFSFRLARAKAAAIHAQARAEASEIAQEKALEAARKDIRDSFSLLARAALDDNTDRAAASLERLLAPFKDRINTFDQSFASSELRAQKDRSALCERIDALARDSRSLSQNASNLTQALRGDVKFLGSWGEFSLERLLEAAGLEAPLMYEIQKGFNSGRDRPDAIVRLPGERAIVIDSKLPFARYMDYVNARSDADREAAAKAHVAALETQIRLLSDKDYPHLAGLPSAPDFSILFVASEPALALALSRKSDLLRDAAARKIILAGPSTLLATLRVVSLLWQLSARAKDTENIAEELRKTYDQFVLFAQSMVRVRDSIDRAADACDHSIAQFSTGKGNLLSHLDKIRRIAETRQPPADFLPRNEAPDNPGSPS